MMKGTVKFFNKCKEGTTNSYNADDKEIIGG